MHYTARDKIRYKQAVQLVENLYGHGQVVKCFDPNKPYWTARRRIKQGETVDIHKDLVIHKQRSRG